MANNPSSITKFRALTALDRWSDDPNGRAGRYDQALERLADPGFDLLGQTVAGIERIVDEGAPDPMAHLDAHWLHGAMFESLDATNFKELIRTGFHDAISDAKGADLPLNVVWVNGGEFRVDHVVGSSSVTVAIITPAPR